VLFDRSRRSRPSLFKVYGESAEVGGGASEGSRPATQGAFPVLALLFGLRKQALKQQVLLESFHSVDLAAQGAGPHEGCREALRARAEQWRCVSPDARCRGPQ
jgi:hypothetical protein